MTATRIRWSDEEKLTLAKAIIHLTGVDAALSQLDALRQAQEALPHDRRREIKAWTVAEPMLGPVMAQLREQGVTPTQASVVSTAAAQVGPALAADSVAQAVSEADVNAGQAPNVGASQELGASDSKAARGQNQPLAGVGAIDPLAVEGALLVALQSPAVRAVVQELLVGAVAHALKNLTLPGLPSGAAEQEVPSAIALANFRVLMAGFSGPGAKGFEDALKHQFDVRTWRPGQPLHMLEALKRICSVAVIPESADDEAEAMLRTDGLRVLRHEGSPSRLLEQLQELAEELVGCQ